MKYYSIATFGLVLTLLPLSGCKARPERVKSSTGLSQNANPLPKPDPDVPVENLTPFQVFLKQADAVDESLPDLAEVYAALIIESQIKALTDESAQSPVGHCLAYSSQAGGFSASEIETAGIATSPKKRIAYTVEATFSAKECQAKIASLMATRFKTKFFQTHVSMFLTN